MLSDLETGTRRAADILREIDPEFANALDGGRETVAAHRLRRLLVAWTSRSIPVLHAEVESPLDVLEVFTRINLGGVQVGGTDVYFAAVKTFWNEAESGLDRVGQATGEILDRIGALQIVSRLASRGIGQGDLLPLTVDRLAGPRGAPLITAMQELTADGSRLVKRIRRFSSWLVAHSRLGFGIRLVSGRVWDEVLAWAVISTREDDAWYAENLPTIDAYLLGATLFRYPRVLGDSFRRTALLESLAAGVDGRHYPLQRILEVVRAGNHGLRGTRDRVRTLGDPDDRQWTADRNTELLVSIAQRLPYETTNIDWDHIFPAAQARRMWAVSEYGRRTHHPYRRFVNSTGNFWALHYSTNRALQDTPPALKFPKLQKSLDDRGPYLIWPRDQWSLTGDDVARFIEVDNGLTDDAASIEQAMSVFHDLVTDRANRVLELAITQFPQAGLFAADTEIPSTNPTPESHASFAEGLGMTVAALMVARPAEVPQPVAESGTGLLDLGPTWTGRQDELSRVWDAVTRRHTKLTDPSSRRVLPKQHGGYGFDYMRWIWCGAPNPDTYLCVGVASHHARQGRSPLWLLVWHDTGNYATIRDRFGRSHYGSSISNDRHGLWLPIDLDLELREEQLTEDAYRQIVEIVEIRNVIDARQAAPGSSL